MAFPTDWGRKCELIIQSSQVDGNLTNYPLLLTEDTLPAEIFTLALNGGGDLRVSSDEDGASQLALEVVTFNTGTSKAELWTKVPSVLAASNTSIWIWYQKAGESQPAEDSTYGKENVWKSSFKMVHHLSEDPGAGAPQFIDSTSNDHDGTAQNMTSGNRVAAVIGNGTDFDDTANADHITIPSHADFDLVDTKSFTISFYVYRDGVQNSFAAILQRGNPGSPNYNGWLLQWTQVASNHRLKLVNNATGGGGITDPAVTPNQEWHLYTFVHDNGVNALRFYIDGVLKKTEADAATQIDWTNVAQPLYIGTQNGFINTRPIDGILDEIHLMQDDFKSVDWILAEFRNQDSPNTFVIEQTPGPAAPPSILATKQITHGATEIDFPQFDAFDVQLIKRTLKTQNEAITGANIETILHGHNTYLKIIIPNATDTAFITALETFYQDVSNSADWFEFNMDKDNPGNDTRRDGYWKFLERRYKPRVSEKGTAIELLFVRPGAGS